MADDLKAIVQRMIDAGESEENIATVIQHFKAQAPAPGPPKNPPAMMGGGIPVQYSQVPDADMPIVAGGMMAAGLPAVPAATSGAIRMLGGRPILAKSLGVGAVGAANAAGHALGIPDWLLNPVITAASLGVMGAKGGEPEIAPPAARPEPIATPTRMVGAKMAGTPSGSNFSLSVPSPSGMASLEAAAPTAVDRPVGQPSPNAFVPVKSINPADMPRSWHAFLDPTSRAEADPAELEQAGSLHRELADMDARYKAATMGERATFQNMSPETKNILLGLLTKAAGGS